jgi:hypothetical protein
MILLGHDPVGLGLERGAQARQLVAVADELSELAGLGRGHPGFWEVAPAEAIGELGGVALVVLHPPGVPVQTQWMDEVDLGPEFLEQVGRPVPAIGGLQGHLGLLAGPADGLPELPRFARDVGRLEDLAILVHAHHHRAAAVQVDSHVLSLVFHRSPLPLSAGWFGDPECASHIRFPSAGGTPADARSPRSS